MRTVGTSVSVGMAGPVGFVAARRRGTAPAFAAGMPAGPAGVPDVAAGAVVPPSAHHDRPMAPGAVPPRVVRTEPGPDVEGESEPDPAADVAAVTLVAPRVVGAPARIPPRVVVGVRCVIRKVRAVPGTVDPDARIEDTPARDTRTVDRVILDGRGAAAEFGGPRVLIDGHLLFGQRNGKLFDRGRGDRRNLFGGGAVVGGVRRFERGEFLFLFLFNHLFGGRFEEFVLEGMVPEPVDLTGRRIEHRRDQTQLTRKDQTADRVGLDQDRLERLPRGGLGDDVRQIGLVHVGIRLFGARDRRPQKGVEKEVFVGRFGVLNRKIRVGVQFGGVLFGDRFEPVEVPKNVERVGARVPRQDHGDGGLQIDDAVFEVVQLVGREDPGFDRNGIERLLR